VRTLILICAVVVSLGISLEIVPDSAQGRPPDTLLAMTNSPFSSASAVAIDAQGGIYVGELRSWRRVGTTPSTPADIWSRAATGEVFIALRNGDLYRLEPDWTLTFDSNVFSP
jgi:hypothetical protein